MGDGGSNASRCHTEHWTQGKYSEFLSVPSTYGEYVRVSFSTTKLLLGQKTSLLGQKISLLGHKKVSQKR